MRRVLLALAACLVLTTGAISPAAAQPVKVVATFSVLGDIVRQVGGDKVLLAVLVGPDGDAELYQPTPADAKAIAQARLFVVNGKDFDPWRDNLARTAGFRGTMVTAIDSAKTISRSVEGEGSRHARRLVVDQHAWHDPANGALYAKAIADALAKVDPANAAFYRQRAEAYGKELTDLRAWAVAEMRQIPDAKRKIITSHDGFAYMANAYKITILSPVGLVNDKEPSADDVARLIAQIRRAEVKAIFIENMTDPRIIQRIAAEGGGVVGGTLYSDALSKTGGPADTYVKMLRHNVATMKAAMMKN
ncbi:metal ABC transporter solute-binding protein, Zn/Mn family [Vineibacter terrae]|uniref:metal ABC transporter solute-binding protein, Zn/Mn family n=1 Tax=Vineibacter terrae TaxID=2586908 RepID=UPI002E36F7D7|nr:zinc ABC transporter substrate-binding protein [Vineibacter terrae]HEX2888418.1 zinc ABC transporter substrate-binding protein [Vineibacter terrae]